MTKKRLFMVNLSSFSMRVIDWTLTKDLFRSLNKLRIYYFLSLLILLSVQNLCLFEQGGAAAFSCVFLPLFYIVHMLLKMVVKTLFYLGSVRFIAWCRNSIHASPAAFLIWWETLCWWGITATFVQTCFILLLAFKVWTSCNRTLAKKNRRDSAVLTLKAFFSAQRDHPLHSFGVIKTKRQQQLPWSWSIHPVGLC